MTRGAASSSRLAVAESSCFTEEDALAFAAGHLSAERRARAHRHLDECQECQELLNEAVRALATARTAGEHEQDGSAWSTTFQPGVVVGRRYVIRRFIARGGMGEVYEAFDQELLERVALKTVTSTACDNPSAVRRLKAEVQLARRVSHPNVCRIYDFGSHQVTSGAAPVSFLTMEFVDGETLGMRVRRSGALPVPHAISVARGLLRGLQAAHEAGVLHRDFKSENVILRGGGERLDPLILDFGLARALDRGDGSQASGRGLLGTVAYMAPEQLEGQPHTTACDVYSFGLVWFEMLTGSLPFKASPSFASLTLDRLTKPVPAPSSLNPLVPRELDSLVLACLRRSPRERLQTAAAVLTRLEELERVAPRPKRLRRRTLALLVAGPTAVGAALALAQRAVNAPAAAVPLVVEERAASEMREMVDARTAPTAAASVVPSQPVSTAVSNAAATAAPALDAGDRSQPPAAAPNPPRVRRTPSSGAERVVAAEVALGADGWENPFAGVRRPSGGLGAVLQEPRDGSPPSGHAELPERGR